MNSSPKKINWGFYIFFIPVFLWLLLLFILPQLELLRLSFVSSAYLGQPGITLSNYVSFFDFPVYWITCARTVGYSVVLTLVVLLVALPVAFYITKVAPPKLKGFLLVLVIVPFWVSVLVRVYGWMMILQENGILNHILVGLGIWKKPIELLYNDVAIAIGLVHTNLLFMLVPIIGVMDSLDDALIEAASDLGAKKLTTWWKIILPHCMTGITSGCIVVFMLIVGSYITPSLLGGKNSLWFTEQIYNQFIVAFNWNEGAAFGFLLLVMSFLIVWVFLKITRQTLSGVIK